MTILVITKLEFRMSVKRKPTHSKTFGPTYGDFAIQSADGIIFHFPQFLLSHASPVFKDMFAPRREATTSEQNPMKMPLLVTENSSIWHLLLCHIDPVHIAPAFDRTTISALLLAAEKYQFKVVLDWFEAEIKKVPFNRKDNPLPYILQHPLLIFSLAIRYEMTTLVKAALRELVQCNEKLLKEHVDMTIPMYQYVISLREQRIAWFCCSFLDIVGALAEKKEVSNHPFHSPQQCLHPWTNAKTLWIVQVTQAMRSTPNWKAFTAECSSYTCCNEWGIIFQKRLNEKEAEALVMEEELPDFPDGFDRYLKELGVAPAEVRVM